MTIYYAKGRTCEVCYGLGKIYPIVFWSNSGEPNPVQDCLYCDSKGFNWDSFIVSRLGNVYKENNDRNNVRS